LSAKILKSAVGVVWLLTVGAGFAVVLNYQAASGPSGVSPQRWPSGTAVPLDQHRDTLLMFAHPRCPCTRASIEELNRLLARSHGAPAARVLFYRPGNFPRDWASGDLWRGAAAIPGVSVQEDLDGALARRFGAETSGYVLLYDHHGQLLFKGGITGSRGHAGDNAGEDAILALLNGQIGNVNQTQVYGCSLLGNCEASKEQVFK
jgi:hypothetical protein